MGLFPVSELWSGARGLGLFPDSPPRALTEAVALMTPYSLHNALLLTRTHRTHRVEGNRMPFGKKPLTA